MQHLLLPAVPVEAPGPPVAIERVRHFRLLVSWLQILGHVYLYYHSSFFGLRVLGHLYLNFYGLFFFMHIYLFMLRYLCCGIGGGAAFIYAAVFYLAAYGCVFHIGGPLLVHGSWRLAALHMLLHPLALHPLFGC